MFGGTSVPHCTIQPPNLAAIGDQRLRWTRSGCSCMKSSARNWGQAAPGARLANVGEVAERANVYIL